MYINASAFYLFFFSMNVKMLQQYNFLFGVQVLCLSIHFFFTPFNLLNHLKRRIKLVFYTDGNVNYYLYHIYSGNTFTALLAMLRNFYFLRISSFNEMLSSTNVLDLLTFFFLL